jgi:hypothetical protein
MPSLTPALCFIAALALACPAVHAAQVQGPDAHAADLQPRAYPWLMSRATLVLAGTVENVSGGLFGAGRTATIRVDGLIKGRWNRRDIQVSWNDKDFEETGYRRDARVVVFGVMRKDSTFAQASPGISCWPVEKVEIKGKPARAVEYAYPLDLLSGVPTGVLKTTESVEQSKNFRMAQASASPQTGRETRGRGARGRETRRQTGAKARKTGLREVNPGLRIPSTPPPRKVFSA